MTDTLALSLSSTTSTCETFTYATPKLGIVRVRPHRRIRIKHAPAGAYNVIQGPWLAAVSNTSHVTRELSLEEEFDLVADDTFDWAEETLAIAVETWTEE